MTIPGTTKLTFNVSLSKTDTNRTLVGNLGRNIIRKLIVKPKVMRLLALTITISFIDIMTVGKVQPRGVVLSFKV